MPTVCVHPSPRAVAVPASLWRPLKFPSAAHGCPITKEHVQPKGYPFFRWAYGLGPVVAYLESPPHAATVRLWGPKLYDTPGLYGVKTLWVSKPSYEGPILLRSKRLDSPGRVIFGDVQQLGRSPGARKLISVQIPPGGNSRIYDHGYRSWPGALWVHTPGCYGVQADGTNFTSRFVILLHR